MKNILTLLFVLIGLSLAQAQGTSAVTVNTVTGVLVSPSNFYVANPPPAGSSGVVTWNTRTGAVTLQAADVNAVGPLTVNITGNVTGNVSGSAGSVAFSGITGITGTGSSTTYLNGLGAWTTPAGGGSLSLDSSVTAVGFSYGYPTAGTLYLTNVNADNGLVQLDGQGRLPYSDGSLLNNISGVPPSGILFNFGPNSDGAEIYNETESGASLSFGPGAPLEICDGQNGVYFDVNTGNEWITANYGSNWTQMTPPLVGSTVAGLSTSYPSPVQGQESFVTDALAPTFGATLVGGGSTVAKAFFDGTNWINE
jgi:hypothetical protein